MTSIIYFGGATCGPCKATIPVLRDICQARKIPLKEHDREQDSALALSLGVFSVPCIIRMDDDKETDRKIGLQTKEKLEAFLS